MIANTYGCKWWFIRYVMSGRVARECRRRIEEAEDGAADVLDDNREDEWERLDYLFEEMKEKVLGLHATMERRIGTVKASFQRSLRRSERPRGPSGVPKVLFENALLYTSEVSGLADSCTQKIRQIEERYDELCIRRKAHFADCLELWKAHLKLFAVGAYVSVRVSQKAKSGLTAKRMERSRHR